METIITILLMVLSSFLTYLVTNKLKQNEKIHKYKEEKYSNLLILLQGFVGETANTQTKKKFFEEQYKSWVYASDEVIEAINRMVTLVINSKNNQIKPEEGRKAIGNIVISMRKDLLGKTKLDYKSFTYTDVRD